MTEETQTIEEEEAAPSQAEDAAPSEASADEPARDGVFEFVSQLGPGSLEAYRSNATFREMVDSKIASLVSARSDEMPVPASEEVGGSSEKEVRSGLRGQREAFERSGLGEHMSFDEFIADVEV